MSDRSDSIFRPALLLMSGRTLGFAAAFVIPLVLVRIFDQGEFGTYKQLFLIFGTLFGIAQLGMAESLYYFLPAASGRGGGYVLNSLLALGGAGLVCLLLLWLLEPVIAGLLNNEALIGYIPLLGIYLLFMLMSALLEIVMTAKKRHMLASGAYVASDVFRAALYILPALLFRQLEWLMYGAITFAALRFLATLVYLYREFDRGPGPDSGLMKRHLGYALPLGLAGMIEILQHNLHMYAVSWHFDAATFAIYAVGCFQVPITDFLMTSTANVLMVRMQEDVQSGGKGVLGMWLDTTRKLAMLFCLIVGGMLVVAPELIVLLFTEDYRESVPIFMIWTLTVFFSTFLTDAVLRVYAQVRFLIILYAFKLLLIAVTINWSIRTFGLEGAVLVTLFAGISIKAVALTRIKTLFRCGLPELLPWPALGRIILIAATAAVPPLALKSTLDLPLFLTFVSSGALYTICYAALMLLLGPLDRDEKQELFEQVQGKFARLGRVFAA